MASSFLLFTARGVLEQCEDVSRCCVVMSQPGHPLTLLHKCWRWVLWEAPILPGAQHMAGAPALLPASAISCLMLKMLCWNGCWKQSWAFWRSCCLVLEKHIARAVFLCSFSIEGGVHMHTHYHKWPQKISDTLIEKYMGFFFLSFSFLGIFMSWRRWHLPVSNYWQPQHLFLPFS